MKTLRLNWLVIMLLFGIISFFACTKVDRVNPYDDKANLSPEEWAPQNLSIEDISITKKKLSWTYDDKNIEGFKIERRIGSGAWDSPSPMINKDLKTFTDTTVIPDTSIIYEYRLNAVAGNNESTQMAVSSKAVFPAPTDLKIVINNESTATITWTDNTNGEEGFRVEKKTNNENWQVLASIDKNIISYQDNSFSLITAVNYRVSATARQIVSFSTDGLIHAPSIITSDVADVSTSTSQCGGTISGINIPEILDKGVCYGTSQNPTIEGVYSNAGSGSGSFSILLSPLSENTLYYFRAYATTIAGIFYGEEKTFLTLPITLPIITTSPITGITQTTAISRGTVVYDGGSPIIAKGVCWSANQNPDTTDSHTNNGSGTGSFTSNITGLTINTLYYVRAYATNSLGTSYGNEVSFTAGTIIDIDGNVYTTVIIGTQQWMTENLKVTHYRNGEPIPNVTDAVQWSNLTTGAFCWLNNDEASNKNVYGALYNYYTVVDSRNLCPTGWHIPSDGEWTTLTNYLGGESVAGSKMKETGTAHWYSPNTDATNESGFTGLPGGVRNYYSGTFSGPGPSGYWWSSTQDFSTYYAWFRALNSTNGNVDRVSYFKELGLSVRCVKY